MTRLPGLAFATLVLATIGAFFITQHLKTTTPLINGFPAPDPPAINPRDGRICGGVDYRYTKVSFYLQRRSDYVDVYVVDSAGRRVAVLARHRFMRGGAHPVRTLFVWDGRRSDGRIASDGAYYIRVRLLEQQRTLTISDSAGPEPVTVETVPPRPEVTAVAPQHVVAARGARVAVDYGGNEGRLATVLIYRRGSGGGYRLVKTFLSSGRRAVWDLTVGAQLAPPGSYLFGLSVTDAACNTGTFPARLPPPPALAARDTVTVSAAP